MGAAAPTLFSSRQIQASRRYSPRPALLDWTDLPDRPPWVAPARAPPQAELDFVQTPTFDLDALEPVPEFELDQSSPQDWDA